MASMTRGASSAPTASMNDWWTPKDAEVFTARTARLIKEFSASRRCPA